MTKLKLIQVVAPVVEQIESYRQERHLNDSEMARELGVYHTSYQRFTKEPLM